MDTSDKVAEAVPSPTKPDIGRYEHPMVKALIWIGVIMFFLIFGLYTYAVFNDKALPDTGILATLGGWFVEIIRLVGGGS